MLLREIENDLINVNLNLSNVLMKAKILASRLKNQELKDWVEKEINGYNNTDILPSYRVFNSSILGDFSGPFQSGLKNAQIPISLLDKKDQEIFSPTHYFYDSLKSLEELSKSQSDPLFSFFNGDMIVYLNLCFREKHIYPGYECISASLIIPKSKILDVMENVKNKLLSIVLELQEIYPEYTRNDESLDKIPNEGINQIFTYNIYGKVDNIASGYKINQRIKFIKNNDIDSLLNYLENLGVEKQDINELKNSIQKDNIESKNNGIGIRVKGWISKMSIKYLEMSITEAGKQTLPLIISAIQSFFTK